MWPYINPQAPGSFFFAHVPFMLDETEGLLQPLCSQRFIAAQPNEAQSRKSSATSTDAKSLGKPLHVLIDGHQYSLVRKSRGTDDVVWRLFG